LLQLQFGCELNNAYQISVWYLLTSPMITVWLSIIIIITHKENQCRQGFIPIENHCQKNGYQNLPTAALF
jgi:hypothetical protein